MITNDTKKTNSEKNINNIIVEFQKSNEIVGIDQETYRYFAHEKTFMIGYHENTNKFIAHHDNKVKAMLDYNINMLISKKELANLNNDNSYEHFLKIIKNQYLKKLIQKQKKVLDLLADSKKDYLLGKITFNDLNQYSKEKLVALFDETIYGNKNTNRILPVHLDLEATIFYASNINQGKMPLYEMFYFKNSKIKKNQMELLNVLRLIENVLLYSGLLFNGTEINNSLFYFIYCLNNVSKKHPGTYSKFISLEKDNIKEYIIENKISISLSTNSSKIDSTLFMSYLRELRNFYAGNKDSREFADCFLNIID